MSDRSTTSRLPNGRVGTDDATESFHTILNTPDRVDTPPGDDGPGVIITPGGIGAAEGDNRTLLQREIEQALDVFHQQQRRTTQMEQLMHQMQLTLRMIHFRQPDLMNSEMEEMQRMIRETRDEAVQSQPLMRRIQDQTLNLERYHALREVLDQSRAEELQVARDLEQVRDLQQQIEDLEQDLQQARDRTPSEEEVPNQLRLQLEEYFEQNRDPNLDLY